MAVRNRSEGCACPSEEAGVAVSHAPEPGARTAARWQRRARVKAGSSMREETELASSFAERGFWEGASDSA